MRNQKALTNSYSFNQTSNTISDTNASCFDNQAKIVNSNDISTQSLISTTTTIPSLSAATSTTTSALSFLNAAAAVAAAATRPVHSLVPGTT